MSMRRPTIALSPLPTDKNNSTRQRPSSASVANNINNNNTPSSLTTYFATQNQDISKRLQSSMTPSVLQNTRGGGLSVSAASRKSTSGGINHSSSSITLYNSNNNTNKKQGSSAASAALSAIKGDNHSNNDKSNKSSGNKAHASPELVRTWREPFQALQRLVDRSHQQQLEDSGILNGSSSSPGGNNNSNQSKYAKRFGNMIVQSRIGGGMNNNNNINNNSSSPENEFSFLDGRLQFGADGSGGLGGVNDPFVQLDQLYSKAKRKWIDLCVTLRVPEEERQLIEKQISQRDTLKQMNTSLSILHSEIERLIDLFHWSGVLRKAIEEREKALVQFLSFISEYASRQQIMAAVSSDNNKNSSNHNNDSPSQSSSSFNEPPMDDLMMAKKRPSSGSGSNSNSARRFGVHGVQSSSSNNKSSNSNNNQNQLSPAEVCLKVTEKLLLIRNLTADVYTAHRKWQVAHGTTSAPPLFVYKGTSYLEKIMQDLPSVIDTDSSDMDRAIDREKRRNERINNSSNNSGAFGGGKNDDESNSFPSTGRKSSPNTSSRGFVNNNNNKTGGPSSGGSSGRSGRNNNNNNNNNRLSSIVGSNLSPAERSKRLQARKLAANAESHVIRKFPDWMFSLVIWRVCRQNCLLDVRKRRTIPAMVGLGHLSIDNGNNPHDQEDLYLQQQQQEMMINNANNNNNPELFEDFDNNDKFQRQLLQTYLHHNLRSMLDRADDELSKLLSERCSWSIEDYFQSATRAVAEIRITWKFASEVLHKKVEEIAVDPKSLGIVRSEFLRDIESNLDFVVDHEKATVDRLVEKSIQEGMYGNMKQQEQFNRLVEEHQARQLAAKSAVGGTRTRSPSSVGGVGAGVEDNGSEDPKGLRNRSRSSISSLMEASQLMGMNHRAASFSASTTSMNSSSSSPFGDVNSVAHQMMCIVKIQKKIRTHLARKVARKLWQEKIAATLMQAWARRFLCQCRFAKMRRRWKAACRIQAFYRACVVRSSIRSDIEFRRAERERRIAEQYLDTNKNRRNINNNNNNINHIPLHEVTDGSSPNRILIVADRPMMVSPKRGALSSHQQKRHQQQHHHYSTYSRNNQRSYLLSSEYEEQQQTREEQEQEHHEQTLREYLHIKAAKIQATYRGFREYRFGAGEAVREWRMVLHINRAAAKIQALVRGVLVRKEAVIVRKIREDVILIQRVGRGYCCRRGEF